MTQYQELSLHPLIFNIKPGPSVSTFTRFDLSRYIVSTIHLDIHSIFTQKKDIHYIYIHSKNNVSKK
jgi:hypothetical protein